MTAEPVCPTPCDADCEADCHELHQVGYKQNHCGQVGCPAMFSTPQHWKHRALAEEYPTITRAERDHLRALRRRMFFLDRRIANYHGKDPSHDMAERSALRWILLNFDSLYKVRTSPEEKL